MSRLKRACCATAVAHSPFWRTEALGDFKPAAAQPEPITKKQSARCVLKPSLAGRGEAPADCLSGLSNRSSSAASARGPPAAPAFDPLGRASASPGAKAKASKATSGAQQPTQSASAQRPLSTEDVQATLAALEAQTRVTTGSSAGASTSGASGVPEGLLRDLEGLDEESYQALLREFEHMGGDPGLAGALDSFMSTLLSKEVLYEPLRQISMRYPSYLAAAREKGVAADALQRYTRQAALVAELLSVFDRSPQDVDRIMALMQDMQRCGAPPPEIMQDIAPDLKLGEDGLPALPNDQELSELQRAGGSELADMCAQQ